MQDITIKLTKEQYEILLGELYDLESYKWRDDHIHADNSSSKIKSIIQDQGDQQLLNSTNHVGVLTIETDWDFSIMLNGVKYADMDMEIPIEDVKILDTLLVGGPFGSGPFVPINESKCKVWELNRGIERIKSYPKDSFSELGGNRGVEWQVKSTT